MPQLRHRLVSRIRATPRYLVVLTLLYLLGTPVAARPEPSSELPALLAATAQPSSAREVADSTLKSVVGSVSQDIWPYAILISAEIHRQKNGTVTALNEYRQLADWGAENAREHGWGGSALATFALWRWLRLVDHEANEKDARWALVTAKALRDSRFAQGLFASLPRIEADMARRLAVLAWSNNFPEAIPLFIDFLSVAYADDLSED
ncbi:MAG TPA: hypothetical protein VLB11_07825, partial [Methyloceanibacter sp.]|nr:hypothetical protein [Methyloceanibacter sp.]